ncbi:hypothetical protein PPYR_05832 [Photinus pyralis]|uniref:Uncharacterized protein n=1 Tax=Photinus pyralis TaxID=7054 RepID=A0A5N4AW71_PHOPY|nr:hypothetical protein PPYR_05832 [Photinus pyralis]
MPVLSMWKCHLKLRSLLTQSNKVSSSYSQRSCKYLTMNIKFEHGVKRNWEPNSCPLCISFVQEKDFILSLFKTYKDSSTLIKNPETIYRYYGSEKIALEKNSIIPGVCIMAYIVG